MSRIRIPVPRRLRLSLRTLMVLVLMVGGTIGWLVHRARVQRDVVRAVERAGGNVIYRWAWTFDAWKKIGTRPPWPKWLADPLGPDFFGTVTSVYFQNGPAPGADDDLMARIARLDGLESLCFTRESRVTDNGLVHLREMESLEQLDPGRTRALGLGLVHLKGLSRLK